jgi:hypothetical protein
MLEETFEHRHDLVLDKYSRASQRRDDWQPADLLRHSVTENWHQRKFGVHVHFGTNLAVAHLQPGDYCARFDSPSEAFLQQQACLTADRQVQTRSFEGRGRGGEGSVLVPIVDYLYVPEQCGFRPLPAVVRLQPLHCCPYATRNTGHVALRASKLPPPVHQRELDMSLLRFRSWSREQEHQMIEGGSEVVGSVSDEDAQFRGHGLRLGDLEDEPAFTILLRPNGIEARLQKRVGRIVHRIDVLLCPPELPSHGV